MSQAQLTPTELLSKRRFYRRLMAGCVLGGVAVSLLLRYADYPLAGELVYWLGIGGFLAVWQGTSVTLFDERDAELERRASITTLSLAVPVLVLGASAARVLPRVTDVTVPAVVWGALYGYAALFAVFGVTYGWYRYRP